MTVGAVLASASAINADYFGASKLPDMLSQHNELPSVFHRRLRGRSIVSLVTIGIIAFVAVNAVTLDAISAATSGGFLLVYEVVNVAAVKLAKETGCQRFVPAAAALLCIVALAVMVAEFLSHAATVGSGIAVGAIIVMSVLIGAAFRATEARRHPTL